jgi:hypothetical protein
MVIEGECRCEPYYTWCNPEIVDDFTCCPDPSQGGTG